MRIELGALLAVALLAGSSSVAGTSIQQEEDSPRPQPVHGEECPADCATCGAAVERALDYLAAQQQEDGSFPAKRASLRYVRSDRHVVQVMTAALAGLAFRAEGSSATSGRYSGAIQGVERYLRLRVEEILAADPVLAGGGGGPIYSTALSLLFFTHLYERTRNSENAGSVKALVRYLSGRVGSEVGKSAWQRGKDTGAVWYVSGVTALLNLTVIALVRAAAAGFRVEDGFLDLARSYYRDIAERNGSFKYDIDGMFPTEPRQGRSVAALLALKGLGCLLQEEYASALAYARKNVDRTMAHHTPSLHMTLGAFAFHALGAEDWEKFAVAHMAKLVFRQQEDGRLETIWDEDRGLMMQPNDLEWGPNYATANFALIVQIPRGYVRLYSSRREY